MDITVKRKPKKKNWFMDNSCPEEIPQEANLNGKMINWEQCRWLNFDHTNSTCVD